MRKVSMRWKNWSDFKGLHSIQFSRRKFFQDRDTILELTAKIQELQNEFNCMNVSRDSKDAESVRSGQSHVTSQPAFFRTFSKSWRNAKPFSGNAEPQRWAAKYLGHAWYIGKRFCKSNQNTREGLSVGQLSSSVSERTGRPVEERTGRPVVERGQELNTEHTQIRTLLDRQKEQILAECQAEIKKHWFQANYDRRNIQKLSATIESQQEEFHRAQAEELQRRDQHLLHAQFLQQNLVGITWSSW